MGESAVDQLLARARASLDRVEPEDLAGAQAAGALVVDIRPDAYRLEEGELPGAVVVDRNHVEWWLDPTSDAALPEVTPGQRVIIACNEGYASSLAAATLRDLGVDATDLDRGLPGMVRPRPPVSTCSRGRPPDVTSTDGPVRHRRIEATPLGDAFAVRLEGLALRGIGAGSPLAAELRELLAEHKVLVVSEQHLSPDELVAAGRLFGTLTAAHPVMPPIDAEHPEVLEIDATRSRTDPRYRDEWENDTWHTDVSFMPDPPLGSLLSGVVVPPGGGDTAFADLQAAYDALSAPVRARLDGLEAEHDGAAEFAAHLRDRPEGGSWSGRRFTVLRPVVHPVVRVHPVTGRRGLFVNPTFTTRVLGVSHAESDALLRLLYDVATAPERTYRHRWSTGDVVVWDNRATAHVGMRDYGDAHRVLHRVTIAGDRPRGPKLRRALREMRGRAGPALGGSRERSAGSGPPGRSTNPRSRRRGASRPGPSHARRAAPPTRTGAWDRARPPAA